MAINSALPHPYCHLATLPVVIIIWNTVKATIQRQLVVFPKVERAILGIEYGIIRAYANIWRILFEIHTKFVVKV